MICVFLESVDLVLGTVVLDDFDPAFKAVRSDNACDHCPGECEQSDKACTDADVDGEAEDDLILPCDLDTVDIAFLNKRLDLVDQFADLFASVCIHGSDRSFGIPADFFESLFCALFAHFSADP